MKPDTFLEFWSYLENKQRFRPRSLDEYKRVLRDVSLHIDLLKAKNKQVVDEALLKTKELKGWGDMMYPKAGSILVKFYRWLTVNEKIRHNPYPFCDIRRPPLKEPKWLDEETYLTILKHPLLSLQEHCILRALWDTGVRRGELALLNVADIDFENNMLHVSREISKGEYSFRWCPFTPETADYLKEHIEKLKKVELIVGPLFLSPLGKRINDNHISEKIRAIGGFFNIHLTPHMFRHGWGARVLDKEPGASLFVMKNLGHSSPATTAHYTHLSKKTNRKIYDIVTRSA